MGLWSPRDLQRNKTILMPNSGFIPPCIRVQRNYFAQCENVDSQHYTSFKTMGHYDTPMSARVSTNNRKETNSPHIMTSSHSHDILCPDVGGRDSLQSKMTLPTGPAQKGRTSSSALWKPDTTSSWWQCHWKQSQPNQWRVASHHR